ncbi:MAG: hypothetical protein U0610_30985 [bacterium]
MLGLICVFFAHTIRAVVPWATRHPAGWLVVALLCLFAGTFVFAWLMSPRGDTLGYWAESRRRRKRAPPRPIQERAKATRMHSRSESRG